MIQFDNGPAGGDYVRYIERLVAERLLIPAMKQGEGLPSGVTGPTTSVVTGVEAVRAAVATRVPEPRLSPAQANAIAATLMTTSRDAGEVLRRAVDDRIWLDVLGIVAGAGIALFGLFTSHASLVFIVVGVGLIISRFKRIVERQSAAPAAAEANVSRQTFGSPPRNP